MGAILAALAKGLLSALASKIFSSIFGGHSADYYFKEMLKDIKNILHISLVSNDIVNIKGTVDGVISEMTINYPNMKASGSSKESLLAYLSNVESTIDLNIMGPLTALTDETQAKGNAQQSLLVFAVGAGMHFAVLQEMAKQDPSQSNPAQTQYAKDIQQYAKKYVTRATELLANIRKSRLDSIKGPSCGPHTSEEAENITNRKLELELKYGRPPKDNKEAMGWPSGTIKSAFYGKDGWKSKTICEFGFETSIWYPCEEDVPAHSKCKSCLADYKVKAAKTFDSDWQPLQDNIDAWQKLETNPVSSS
ncbi:hypothetical protein [Algoriphagus sediminis]|uniref:Uncharacterized protein n=1 Tax=Algoriphagus sediminis TaxID=3057113 RepID=A0ABT7Y8S8_9BACT|nr:hypothetical protein [Algoriphagus sediminis]MDN3202928.1 hypothetical protein [Algoriphagus sediminis]